jgi:hypothetical protein
MAEPLFHAISIASRVALLHDGQVTRYLCREEVYWFTNAVRMFRTVKGQPLGGVLVPSWSKSTTATRLDPVDMACRLCPVQEICMSPEVRS